MERSVTAIRRLLLKLIMKVKVQKSRKMNFQGVKKEGESAKTAKNELSGAKEHGGRAGRRGGGVLKRATGTDRPVIESIADYSHMMNAGLSR